MARHIWTTAATFASLPAMKLWPEKPGSTDITSIMSTISTTGASASMSVPGFMLTAHFTPEARISSKVFTSCGTDTASVCTVIESAPASMNQGTCFSGLAIIRCTSNGMRA